MFFIVTAGRPTLSRPEDQHAPAFSHRGASGDVGWPSRSSIMLFEQCHTFIILRLDVMQRIVGVLHICITGETNNGRSHSQASRRHRSRKACRKAGVPIRSGRILSKPGLSLKTAESARIPQQLSL